MTTHGTNLVIEHLLRPCRNTTVKTWFALLPLVLCSCLYIFHFLLIWKHAVDVPYRDEWASFKPNQLPTGLSKNGLIAQHREHRLATTRLLVWLQYNLNEWDLAVHQKANFLLYALILVSSIYIIRDML